MIVKLKNGDPVPTVETAGGQRSVAEIIAPYSKYGIVKLGENEAIHCFEVFTAKKSSQWFDLQDLVLLVSYEQVSVGG